MAQKNLKEKEREAARQENIEQTVSATEQFYNNNKKLIWGVVAAILVIGLGSLAYNKFVFQPKCVEAMQQTYPAEMSFQSGEYDLALNGDGNNMGFADIIAEYGTKSGKAVYLYAGICELQLGNYDQALSYLKKYKGKEPVLAARARACEGDAYVALGDYAAAVRSYKAAAQTADNAFAAGYLLKEGSAHEALGQKAEALACYKAIQQDYPQSLEAYEIAKNIARVAE
ncbi:MAG: tetratricopeptide repeat protein [Bacteroidales bacterium]|nr:tetratricopeptide repeat protein [Bacteroidales bacterium]